MIKRFRKNSAKKSKVLKKIEIERKTNKIEEMGSLFLQNKLEKGGFGTVYKVNFLFDIFLYFVVQCVRLVHCSILFVCFIVHY